MWHRWRTVPCGIRCPCKWSRQLPDLRRYQGPLYCVNNGGGAAKGTLFRIMLDSGEKEIQWEPEVEAEPGLDLRMCGATQDNTAWIEGDRLYLQGGMGVGRRF